ncbi:hypothetical protein [Gaiella sp.]|jgi:hypothetical protein|uniref:hypothetical protein n=1 Tax=Gaiella sp. TaxID=2663207 RepID=UPI002E34C891|nr:hypothetical protein [Gaiella sp.]HEX5584732.1 hypothetical protein [Gaiella sp.]
MGALARLTDDLIVGHHLDPLTLTIEAVVLALVVLGLGAIWLRERRRRVNPNRRVPELRD